MHPDTQTVVVFANMCRWGEFTEAHYDHIRFEPMPGADLIPLSGLTAAPQTTFSFIPFEFMFSFDGEEVPELHQAALILGGQELPTWRLPLAPGAVGESPSDTGVARECRSGADD